MPPMSHILDQISKSSAWDGPANYDGVGGEYLRQLSQHTGRDVILYASGWLQ